MAQAIWHRIATIRERLFGRRMLAFHMACATMSAADFSIKR